MGFTATVNEHLADERPDAPVLDCSVYEMSESLFDMVRSDPAHPDLPIVIISDTPEKADASLRSRETEHVLLVPKPFTGGANPAAPHPALPRTPCRRTHRTRPPR